VKLLNLFRRRRLERDLARELRYHVERRVDDMMRSGMTEAEARRQAAIEFGGIPQVQENVRDMWMWAWLETLIRDVRYAARTLARSWTFTLGAGGILALGIGANTAIFSVVNTVLIRPLAYPDADRIVSVETRWTNNAHAGHEVSGPDFLDWQARTDIFDLLAHAYGEDDVATVVGERGEFANFRYVSPDFFAVFGQPPAAGKLLTRQEALGPEQRPAVAVVAHDWAEAHFGSAQAAVGKPLKVYNLALQIVGVAAPGFRYPDTTNIWIPSYPTPTDRESRSDEFYSVVGKLKAGVAVAAAQATMRTVGEESARRYQENRFKAVALASLQDRLSSNVRRTLWVLMGAVGVVLLIACANIANLLLARSAGRAREIALRAALGAGRGRVIRQLLTENLVLTALATAAGVILARLLLDGLVAIAPPGLPRVEEVHVDGTVLAFALALSIASTLIFGLVPAFTASRLDLAEAMKSGSPRAAGGASRRLRATLVVAEVALSVMLLAAAGLLLRSFLVLNHVDLGFATDRVLTAYTQYVVSNAQDRRLRMDFYRDLLARVRAVPGVVAASGANFLPLGREIRPSVDYLVQGRADAAPESRLKAEYQVITPDYFKTLGIPLRAGREFTDADTPETLQVAVINETLARTAFPGQSAIGQRIRLQTMKDWMEIVGVAADTRWHDPSQAPAPELFTGSMQGRGGSLSLFVRTSSDDEGTVKSLDALLRSANTSVPVRFETMDDLFASALAYPRLRTQLIAIFAGIAALLAAVGIFSVLAYIVGQRTSELAVRRVVGAGVGDVVRLVIGEGMRLIVLGLAIGLLGSLAVAKSLEGLLFEISPWDLWTYVGAVAVLGIAALLATVLPAMRAATIDPLLALRHQ
jgi:putative ABC transport system permease protein